MTKTICIDCNKCKSQFKLVLVECPELQISGGLSPKTEDFVSLEVEDKYKDVYDLCKEGDLEGVKYNISEYPDLLESKNSEGETPLYIACRHRQPEVVKYLISQGANINTVNNEGNSALHIAVSCQDREVIKCLISAGADLNQKNEEYGYSPLRVACYIGDTEMARYLVDAGCNILSCDDESKNILTVVMERGYYDLAKYLASKL